MQAILAGVDRSPQQLCELEPARNQSKHIYTHEALLGFWDYRLLGVFREGIQIIGHLRTVPPLVSDIRSVHPGICGFLKEFPPNTATFLCGL